MMFEIPEAATNAMKSQLFAGGVMLTIMGSIIAWGRMVPMKLFNFVKRRFVVQVDIVGTDPLFAWFTRWLDSHPQIKKSRLLTASIYGSSAGGLQPSSIGSSSSEDGEPKPPDILFTPAPGSHFLFIRGRPVMLTRERKEAPSGRNGDWGGYQETYTIRAFGRSSAMLRAVLEEARDRAQVEQKKCADVYGFRYGEWRLLTNIRPRPMSSIFLAEGQLERVTADLEEFLRLESWYNERGIPWRRAHMYEGPPGTGKSSVVSALAGHLGLNLYICPVSDKHMTDEKLLSAVQDMRPRSILLLEDVDALVTDREVTGDSGVTFAGLLNALDGVTSKPGVVTIMTTNHPERLDPALVRKGRVDLCEHFGVATRDQAERLYRHFYSGEPSADDYAAQFAAAGEGRAMSDLQGAMLDHKKYPLGALSVLTNTQPRMVRSA